MTQTLPQKTISVVVPVFDPNSEYRDFLYQLLVSVEQQSITPMEVVLTANHPLPYTDFLKARFSENLDLAFYERASSNAPDNVNFGVSVAKGEVVKLLFQDDFLIDREALSFAQKVSPSFPWMVCASQNTSNLGLMTGRKVFPIYSNRLRRGENLIGAPSVASFLRESFVKMDGRLPYLFDVDWYLSMGHRHGLPLHVSTPGVGIREHPGQATHWARYGKRRELRILSRKHPTTLGKECPCTKNQTP